MDNVDEQRRRVDWLELIQIVLLSIGALLIAWCGNQASQWGSIQSVATSDAIRQTVAAARQAALAGQDRLVDLISFEKWLDATATGNESLAIFHRERFRAEFKPVFEAWLASEPLNNSAAAETPFAMAEYAPMRAQRAFEMDAKSEGLMQQALEASDISGRYVRLTLFYATAMFFAGLTKVFKRRNFQYVMLTISGLFMLVGLSQMARLPVI
jgi:hypothetical protein